VRFLLSPPPEESMGTRQQGSRSAREPRIVLPSALKEEEIKLGTASSWNRSQLKLLGVDFYMNRPIDLNRILKVKETDWTPEIRTRMALLSIISG
jgi:hypothetical protein